MTDKTIFISCPTMDDTEYAVSIEDCFKKAKNPDRVFVGTAYSIEFKNKKKVDALRKSVDEFSSNIRLDVLNYNNSSGVGYGRLASMMQYNNEDYVLQVDAHCLWQKDWDEKLISLYHEAQSYIGYEEILLTGYMPYYKYFDYLDRRIINGWKLRYPFMLGETFINWGHPWDKICGWTDIEADKIYPEIKEKFLPSVKISAGFDFGGPNFAKQYQKFIPFPFRFFEEELVMTIELLDAGFCPVYINDDIPIAHLYASDINEFGGKRSSGKPFSANEADRILERYIEYINSNIEKVKAFEEYSMIGNILSPSPESKNILPSNFYKGSK